MTDTGFGPHKFGIDMIGHSSGFNGVNPLTYGPIFGPANDLLNGKPVNLTEGFNDVVQSLPGYGRSYETKHEESYGYTNSTYSITEYGANGAYRTTGITVNENGFVGSSFYERSNPVTGELVREDGVKTGRYNIQEAFGYEQANKGNSVFYEEQLTDFLREFQAATGETILVTGFNSYRKNPESDVPHYTEEKVDFTFDEPAGYVPPAPAQAPPTQRAPAPQFIIN